MNKTGSVPVVLFVISVFAVCTISLFLFLTADASQDRDFKLLLGIIQESVGVEESVNFFVNEGREINIEGLRKEGDYYVYNAVKYRRENFFVRIWKGVFGGEDIIDAEIVYRFKP